MNPWSYYFYLRGLGYAPHMACMCALMNGCDRAEYHRRLETVARWLNRRLA